MGLIRGVVMDLDDTLYLERDYVRSGFRHVARLAGGPAAAALFAFLWGEFEQGVRGDSFGRLLRAHPALAARWTVADLVQAYRGHRPDIAAPRETLAALRELQRAGLRLGLLSDGPLAAQQAKLAALGLAGWFAPAVFTDVWGRRCWKPHPRGFCHIARVWRLPAAELAYVGDNPARDFITPRRLGWHTVRVRRPGQLHREAAPPSPAHAPAAECPDLGEAVRWLLRLT